MKSGDNDLCRGQPIVRKNNMKFAFECFLFKSIQVYGKLPSTTAYLTDFSVRFGQLFMYSGTQSYQHYANVINKSIYFDKPSLKKKTVKCSGIFNEKDVANINHK